MGFQQRLAYGRRTILKACVPAVVAAVTACGEKTGVAGGYKFTGARPSDSEFISDEERERLREQIEAEQAARNKATPTGG